MLCFFAGLTERKEIVPLLTLLRQGQKNLKSSFQEGVTLVQWLVFTSKSERESGEQNAAGEQVK